MFLAPLFLRPAFACAAMLTALPTGAAAATTCRPTAEPAPSVELDFATVLADPGALLGHYHLANGSLHEEGERRFLRVAFPRGSVDPGGVARLGAPAGGIGFRWKLPGDASDCLHLSYLLRFAPDFPFVKGGKLPGLGGGSGNTGGHIPTGRDGFSARFMWRSEGLGEIYAYLPDSHEWGSSLGAGSWRFARGEWIRIEQTVQLNTPGRGDGMITVWINGKEVYRASGLRFRDVPELRIDQLLFETFFGGNTLVWATPQDTWIDFAELRISR